MYVLPQGGNHLKISGEYERSALHYASENGWESAVAKLLSLGADAGLKDGDGMTALMLACVIKNESAALLLMEATQKAGALDVQGGDKQSSALHYASVNGWESAVAKLLSLGADAALIDKVRACSYMNTCKCSVDVCMFVNVLLIRISLSIMHIIQTCYNTTRVCVCV